jgi:hypothetical protein
MRLVSYFPAAMAALGVLALSTVTALATSPARFVLRNGEIRLELDSDPGGVPRIACGKWDVDGAVIFEAVGAGGLDAWFPKALAGEAPPYRPVWRAMPDVHFLRAEATRRLARGLEATWIVELAKRDALLRVGCWVANRSQQPAAVERFPIFAGNWRIPACDGRARWWEALSFRPLEQALTDRPLRLESQYHSSDRHPLPGVNPYWMFLGDRGRLMFSLSWCGGWQADLGLHGGLHHISVGLPPEETQLVLKPGETIAGPVLTIVPTREGDDRASRAAWLHRRATVGRALFAGPAPSFPFVWNHWYTVRFNIDENYLRRQVAAMGPYRFDYFVVDAGWYEACGHWVPDTKKFTPGNFETLLAEVRQKGVHPGIWTCPQFVKANANDLPAEVDRPGYYERFIDGHLLDLAGCDFRARLLAHVAMLRQRYRADWWKYDQILFTARTRQGIMRNVIAFQDALTAVRKAQPDLVIENCQSGGRMINEFTVQATQGQWLRDGSGTGLKHARSNFTETLGALEFLPPWVAARWMNRPYDNDPENDALTRAYCRSCMAGTWGLVADLPQIPDRQRKVILNEVDHYRRLSKYKTSCLYDLHHAEPKKPYEAVVFYTADGRAAAVIMLRMQDGPFETVLRLGGLAGGQTYHVEDVDRSEQTQYSADNLRQMGLHVEFPVERLSALLFIEPVRRQPKKP